MTFSDRQKNNMYFFFFDMEDNNSKPLTGNKGEWSEIYALFKLLGDGKVHAGDADMNKLPLYYPILSVIREESKRYTYSPDMKQRIVIIREDGEEIASVPMGTFLEQSAILLDSLNNVKSSEGAFPQKFTESFMKKICCTKLKAPSKDKADIHIMIHDLRTNMTPTLGFSIKSQLGSPSTLLNAGVPTNIRFRIDGQLSEGDVDRINAIKDHLPRIAALYRSGCKLQYDHIVNDTFRNNLLFLDSCMPAFIAECLIMDSVNGDPSIKNAVDCVAAANPFNFKGNTQTYYEHKMKQLLLASALGMTPAKEWNGHFDANGGYLVVKKDGELVCYHFYNQNDVEDYLYCNTRFERASRGRYHFGSIYTIDGRDGYYFDLNLQIRFTK